MGAYRIETVDRSGIERVEPLWRAMVSHHHRVVGDVWPVRDPDDTWRRRRAQYEAWLGEGSGWMLLAVTETGAPPDGYALLRVVTPGPTWELGDRLGELESLAVAEHARGAGIGTLLIDAARQRLRAEGIGYWSVGVVEANEAAMRLYEREGFRPYYRQMLGVV